MLIGICGPICAGKATVADYLIKKHNFTPLTIKRDDKTPTIEKSANFAHWTSAALEFPTALLLDQYVSENWRENYVLTTIWNEAVLDTLAKRPHFILLSIDAPISVRWQRFRERCAQENKDPPALQDFVLRNDDHLYDPLSSLAALSSRAQIRILNPTTTIPQLQASLDALNLLDPARMRPTWDQYFMQLADLAARRSNCMRRQVGCVLVRGKRVISTGYNGTPRNVTNCNEGGCARCNTSKGGGTGLSTCLCLHAEENALLEAGRERVGDGAVLYCNTQVTPFANIVARTDPCSCPCLTCSVKIVQVGITEVVFSQSYHMDTQSAKIFQEAGVRLRQYAPVSTLTSRLVLALTPSSHGKAS
ncbi:deoxycytidylate deaminase [Aureobasidium sp. EXF-10728]|nr:deoxycytidylate deaminase [Aureobasidium sp. EXF-10728]